MSIPASKRDAIRKALNLAACVSEMSEGDEITPDEVDAARDVRDFLVKLGMEACMVPDETES
jgi:hypothetical protein